MVQNRSKLSLDNDRIKISSDDTDDVTYIPLVQVRDIMIVSACCEITTPLLTAAVSAGIPLNICDKRHNPCATVLGLGTESFCPGRMIDQSQWSTGRKDRAWECIVKNKIRNQSCLITKCGIDCPSKMSDYLKEVVTGDIHNMEGQAARLYFNTLFGKDFNRRSPDDLNAMLNYGYSILLSGFNRVVVSHGCSTVLGVNHHSKTNPFNFSCDLMEPFRPFVDEIAFQYKDEALDDVRTEFLKMPYRRICLDGKVIQMADAFESYFLSVMSMLNYDMNSISEVSFIG